MVRTIVRVVVSPVPVYLSVPPAERITFVPEPRFVFSPSAPIDAAASTDLPGTMNAPAVLISPLNSSTPGPLILIV